MGGQRVRILKCKLERHAGLLLKNRQRWARLVRDGQMTGGRYDQVYGVDRREEMEIRRLLCYYTTSQGWAGSPAQARLVRILVATHDEYHRIVTGEGL